MQGVWEHSQTPPTWSEMQENAMFGHAATHVQDMSWIYNVAACQALLRMSPKANAAPRGSAAAQPKEQETDVQMADAPPPTALSAMVAVPMEARNGQPMQIDVGTRVRVRRSRRAVRKPRTLKRCSHGMVRGEAVKAGDVAGEPSGTSRGS